MTELVLTLSCERLGAEAQNFQKQMLAAERAYNADTNKLYRFDKDNAPAFWSSEGAGLQGKEEKK